MHNLVPHFIQENFARGVSQGHFPAIGVFLDLTGFSKLSDILMEHGPHGAEVLAEVMRGLFAPLAEAISGQGGFIAKIAGDAFTALFPLTGSGIASAQRALAVACRQRSVWPREKPDGALSHPLTGVELLITFKGLL
jgi:class 3 adenylate cyclase